MVVVIKSQKYVQPEEAKDDISTTYDSEMNDASSMSCGSESLENVPPYVSRRANGPAARRIVWCSQSCHKFESDEQRGELCKVAKDFHGKLVCLKNSSRFTSWISEAEGFTYILYADFRQVKPCFEALTTADWQHAPAAIIVPCHSGKSYARALAWLQSVGSVNIPVYLQQGYDIGIDLLKNVCGRVAEKQRRDFATAQQDVLASDLESWAQRPRELGSHDGMHEVVPTHSPFVSLENVNLAELARLLNEAVPDHYEE